MEVVMSQTYRAAILDLDGVLTRTASLHARAWKELFDSFLADRTEREGEDHSPFDAERDYLRFVDGKPRLDGVRGFLDARGIRLEGDDRSGGEETIHGLGERKNQIFLNLLEREGARLFEDAVEQLERWRRRGLRTALITSSRNGRRILASTGLQDRFEVVVDGDDAARLGIAGKPAPDIFLHAARELRVEPREAIVVEDAIAGVEAGRAGGFGLVVGVARGDTEGLREAGADLVVGDLREADAATGGDAAATDRDEAFPRPLEHLTRRLGDRRLALFFDYDGTLTPIVRRPEEATLSTAMRSLLRRLASHATVAIVSGRDLSDVRRMVGLDGLVYAGSHGFDVEGPDGLRMQQEEALAHLPALDAAERELTGRVEPISGAWVERKRFAIAVHYREVAEGDVERVRREVETTASGHPTLRLRGGKKIFELQPDVAWDKGRAVRWLLQRLGLEGPGVLPVYVGDDETDEDAFEALRATGLSIRIGPAEEPTRAELHLGDTAELERFAESLLKELTRGGGADG
jgi:trehalose-phosphatase